MAYYKGRGCGSALAGLMAMPGANPSEGTNVLSHNLFDLVLSPEIRRKILLELRHCLFELDRRIVEISQAYLNDNPDESSMRYQTSRSYLSENYSRRPLFVAAKTVDGVLENPCFLREFYLVLVVFLQFKDVVKKYVAPNTLEPVFRRYFCAVPFYTRFITFTPNATRMQTVDSFVREEFSLFLIAISVTKT
jgi:hypothetical protein